jgi:hypothetical protein
MNQDLYILCKELTHIIEEHLKPHKVKINGSSYGNLNTGYAGDGSCGIDIIFKDRGNIPTYKLLCWESGRIEIMKYGNTGLSQREYFLSLEDPECFENFKTLLDEISSESFFGKCGVITV